MKLDERDDRLASLLDRVVDDLDPSTVDPRSVMRRGSRRRGAVVVASLTTVAVFVGAIGLAASQFGSEADDRAAWASVGDPSRDGWTISVPSDWQRQDTDRCPPRQDIAGAVFSDIDFRFTDPDGGSIDCDSRLIMARFPMDGVAIAIQPTGIRWGLFRPTRNTSFPLNADRLTQTGGIRGGPKESFADIVIQHELKAVVRVFVGPDASALALSEVDWVVASLRFAGGDLWVTETVGPDGFATRVTHPDIWKLEPTDELATGGNAQRIFRMRTSGGDLRSPVCGEWGALPHVMAPSIGLVPLHEDQAVITLQAYTGGRGGPYRGRLEFDPRPPRLSWDDARLATRTCGTSTATAATFLLSESGARWIVNVAMGSDVQHGDLGDLILRTLDRLELPALTLGVSTRAPLGFTAAEGWQTEVPPVGGPGDLNAAWTSNETIDPSGQACCVDALALAASLPGDGIVVLATECCGEIPDPTNVNFPLAQLPLTLPQQVSSEWEGYVPGTGRSELLAQVNGRYLQVWIYYGTPYPSDEVRAQAQGALDRLIVAPSEAGYIRADEQNGLSIGVPRGWFVSPEPINTWVSSPREVLAMATYPLRPGGEAVTDFQLPSHAIDDLGPDDMLIWVSAAGTGSGFPPRPERFEPSEPCEGWSRLCPEADGLGLVPVDGVHGWWLGFSDGGRGFYVFVGMGDEAFKHPQLARQPWDILDTLAVDPS